MWFRELTTTLWTENLNAVAEFLGANPENLVFVSNATTGNHLANAQLLFLCHFNFNLL